MPRWIEVSWRAVRAVADALWSFVVWTIWLGLALLLGLQLYILNVSELELPGFVLRQLEQRVAESGLRATFKRTRFDPTGRVLLEDVGLSPAGFEDPVLRARSVYLRLNLWWLTMGRVELHEIQLADVTVAVPAMLSGTGRMEPLLTGLQATLEPERHAIEIRAFSARVGPAVVTAHGRLALRPRGAKEAPPDLPALVAAHFPEWCRQAMAASARLQQLEEPAVHLAFAPSAGGAAGIAVQVLARSVRWDGPVPGEASAVRAQTRFLLFGEAPPSDLEVAVRRVEFPGVATLDGVDARVQGRLRLDGSGFDLREAVVTVDRAVASGIDAGTLSARVIPRGLPQVEASVVMRLLGAPLAVQAEADLGVRRARAAFAGEVSPRVLDVVSERVKTNVRRFYDFTSITVERGEVVLDRDWRFERLTARVRVPRMLSYGLEMEDGRTLVELTPTRFHSPEAFARIGENFAQGSYDHDLLTHAHRFLLEGRLRPLEIARWFRPWWREFFSQLEFPLGPPDASIDLRGVWRDGRQSNIFVFADTTRPIVRGTELDRVRTRLFIRPGWIDGLELLAARDQGNARGTFTHRMDPDGGGWRTVDIAFDSTLELDVVRRLLDPIGTRVLAPFEVHAAPTVHIEGRFSSAAEAGGANARLQLEATVPGEFRFQGFPLHDVAFTARLDRDELKLDRIAGRFAGGAIAGSARVWGVEQDRRGGFDVALTDASLGQVAAELSAFVAARQGVPDAPPDKFVQEKANVRLTLSASAQGRYDNILSYRGDGSALLAGAGLGEVPLLGTLSELLKFTALRFTEARTNFRLEGPKVAFPEVTIRGANAAIDAHGTYALDTRQLDFNARLFPFQDSDNLLKTVVGAVLSPLSSAFEVKLVGTLGKPQWSFVIGPTNLLRSLAPGAESGSKPGEPAPAGSERAPSAPPAPAAPPP